MSAISGVSSSYHDIPVFDGVNHGGQTQAGYEALQAAAAKAWVEPSVIAEALGYTPVYDADGNFLHKPMVTNENWASSKSSTSSDGTFVSVSGQSSTGQAETYALSLGSGTDRELKLDFTGDLRIGTAENGDYLVYSAEKNITTRYAADGTTTEVDGDATANASGKIHVSTTGGEIHGGDGDEVFFVFGNNATIHCGSGNDKVILGDAAENVTIDAGDGDNTITGGQLYGGKITAGNGNNTIQLTKALDTQIALGSGDNSVSVNAYTGGSLKMGDGNNTLKIGSALGVNMGTGEGDNRITVNTMNQYTKLTVGDGNNDLRIGSMGQVIFDNSRKDWSQIEGMNYDELYKFTHNRKILVGSSAAISLGNGNNTVSVGSMINGSSVNIGDGNNQFSVNDMSYNSSVKLGDGNNTLSSREMLGNESFITCGNGSNILDYKGVDRFSSLTVGNGDNYLKHPFGSLYARLANGTHTGTCKTVTDYTYSMESVNPQLLGAQADSELSQRVALLWH